MPPRSLSLTCGVLRGRRLHPIFGVIAGPAWETIAETILPRSLPLVASPESPVGRLPGVSRWSLTRSLPLVAYLNPGYI
jgi:hypothetical protein